MGRLGADAVRRRAVGRGLVQGFLVLVPGRRLEVEDDFLHRAGERVRSLGRVGAVDDQAVVAADVHAA